MLHSHELNSVHRHLRCHPPEQANNAEVHVICSPHPWCVFMPKQGARETHLRFKDATFA